MFCYNLLTLLIGLTLALGVGLVGLAALAMREQAEMVRDAYCLDWASAAIVQHLDDNEGRYPRSWTDLKPAFDKVTARDQSFSFEEVQARVLVDFSATLPRLRIRPCSSFARTAVAPPDGAVRIPMSGFDRDCVNKFQNDEPSKSPDSVSQLRSLVPACRTAKVQ